MAHYIDMHNHILPAIDDGPRTMAEAVLLARDLVAAGYDTVVATPHTFEGKPAPDLILKRLGQLQDELKRQNVPLKLLPGAEQLIEPHLTARLQAGETLTLNQTKYLLLELPMLQPLPVYTEQLLFSLRTEGYRPVIPHPERVIALQRNHRLLYRLHQAGAIFQVTWAAFIGRIGPAAQKTARFMLDANLVHLLATDVHGPSTPLLAVDKAAAYLDQEKGDQFAALMLTTRPGHLLDDRTLDLPLPLTPAAHPRKKAFFLSRLFKA